jgi:hypothetical protein
MLPSSPVPGRQTAVRPDLLPAWPDAAQSMLPLDIGTGNAGATFDASSQWIWKKNGAINLSDARPLPESHKSKIDIGLLARY